MHLRQCVLSVLFILAVFARPVFAASSLDFVEQPSKSRQKKQSTPPPPATEGTISDQPADPNADPNAAGAASSAQTGEVKIEVEKFGCAKVARPGEWTGFRIRVFDTSTKPREVLVRLYGKDPDGDIPVSQRDITTNPNVWQGVWLYTRLPFNFQPGDLLNVACYEANEVKGSDGARFEPGRRIGQVRISPQMLVDSNDDLIAVVGQRLAGLNNYAARPSSGSYPAYSHEPVEIISIGAPTELPDRWLGLSQFSTIVWTAGDPADLRGDRAAALREWIIRGGHLVIVLPTVGQTWTNSTNNELYDLLPAVSIARNENVNLAPYRSLLTNTSKVNLPKDTVLHTFKPVKDAAPGEAIQVLNGPTIGNAPPECLVSRRLVGSGAVTLIGFDLNNRELVDFGGIDPSIFWNRVLGRRGKFPSISELNAINAKFGVTTSRSPQYVDVDIQYQINHSATAGAGVLLGFLTFTAYWLIAGPVGFFMLKNYSKHQFSWLAFIAAGVVFTAVSWTGAAALRPGKTQATHLTYLDHIYGQSTQRARSWMQVLVPHYGDATIAIGDANDKNPQHAITAWEPRINAGSSTFTDTQEYIIDTRAPNAITVPVRATIKQLQVDWAGGAHWKMPIPVKSKNDTSDEPPALKFAKISKPETNNPANVGDGIKGTLVHQLPTALTDVKIIVVRRQQRVTGGRTEQVAAEALVYAIADPWKPDAPLDFETVTRERGTPIGAFVSPLMPAPNSTLQQQFGMPSQDEQPNASQLVSRLLATSLFPLLEPPQENQSIGGTFLAYQRSATHNYDIARWFTQPCIIIIGQLGEGTGKDGAESPVPITIDGAPLPTVGRTVLRWVYPLPDNPPPVDPPKTTEDPSPVQPTQPTDNNDGNN